MEEISSNVICQFLEASIHHILWRRGLYPEVIFASRLAFSVPIKASVHPEVNAYISKSLTCFRDILSRPNITVQGIDLLILDDKEEVVEKYIFQMSGLRCIPYYIQPEPEIADEALKIVYEIPSSVKDLFRNCLLKLTHRVSELPSLDFAQDHSFNMEIHLSENGEEFLAQNHVDVPWLKKENISILPLINKVTRTLPVFRDEDPFHLEVFIDLITPNHHEF